MKGKKVNMIVRLKKLYNEFPGQFWLIIGASFIDFLGTTMVFPFFALYITQNFHVGMTTAGVLLGVYSLGGLIGRWFGGTWTDRFGRRKLIIVGPVFGALSSILLAITGSLLLMYPLSILVGFIGGVSTPAQDAILADLLPDSKRSEGFGISRVVSNMDWLVGPTIAGFVASKSFVGLFFIDAVLSCIVALIVYRFLKETKPPATDKHKEQIHTQPMGGYGSVLRDLPFMAFILSFVVMMMVYLQMYGSLSVYLRDNYHIDPRGYGLLMATSAITVILLQIWTIQRIKNRPPFQMMALGAIFYAIGFTLFGVVGTLALFAFNVFIITVGEMIVVPTSQTLVANFAPEDKRGRYMAVAGFSWVIPSMIGPGLAGYILDHYNPHLLWYLGGIVTLISVAGFYLLHLRLGTRPQFDPAQPAAHSLTVSTD
jgi:MFS family permease